MSEQDGTQAITLKRPANDDEEAWLEYWKAQGQSWRWEPEIDAQRQQYLTKRRETKPDYKQNIYPFMDIAPKLSRADIEWLLATHENGRGPVDWNDESQRERKGLDLRGADLRKVDMFFLPLSKCDLMGAQLQRADFVDTQLQGAYLVGAQLQGACFSNAQLQGADLSLSKLQGAILDHTQLQGTNFNKAELQGAHLVGAQLQGAYLRDVILTDRHHSGPKLADVQWGETILAVVDWSQITILGDEWEAQKKVGYRGTKKGKDEIREDYQIAARAYRQLSIALRNQGINEHAARFTYRAQLMQRKVFRLSRKRGQYLFSLFLDLLSGYGYKPARCFIAYLLVILTFATTYFIIGHKVGPVLSPLGSFVFSMTSFHGRGFFPGGIALDDPLTVVAALEAFIGLLIEVTFIATLTQRLFGR